MGGEARTKTGREASPKSNERRQLLKTLAIVAAASLLSPLASSSGDRAAAQSDGPYYEYFYIDGDVGLEEQLSAYGLIIEVNGRKCVANPLLPDRCMAYVKPYQQDRFAFHPPGSTEDFEARCIRCGLCYFQCHMAGYGAIRLRSLNEAGLKGFGIPVIDDHINRPCNFCLECTTVCPTNAIRPILQLACERARREAEARGEKPPVCDRALVPNYPDLVEEARMGVAMIDPDLCWAWNSGDCKSCAKACPYGAIVFDFWFNEWGVHTRVKATVKIDEKTGEVKVETPCVGCGLCVSACPVGGAAIHVLPVEEYVKRYMNFKNTGMRYDEYIEMIRRVEDTDPEKTVIRDMYVNGYYILNRRGLAKEKIKT